MHRSDSEAWSLIHNDGMKPMYTGFSSVENSCHRRQGQHSKIGEVDKPGSPKPHGRGRQVW